MNNKFCHNVKKAAKSVMSFLLAVLMVVSSAIPGTEGLMHVHAAEESSKVEAKLLAGDDVIISNYYKTALTDESYSTMKVKLSECNVPHTDFTNPAWADNALNLTTYYKEFDEMWDVLKVKLGEDQNKWFCSPYMYRNRNENGKPSYVYGGFGVNFNQSRKTGATYNIALEDINTVNTGAYVCFTNAVKTEDGKSYDLMVYPVRQGVNKPTIMIYGVVFGSNSNLDVKPSSYVPLSAGWRFGVEGYTTVKLQVIEHGTNDDPEPVSVDLSLGAADLDVGSYIGFFDGSGFTVDSDKQGAYVSTTNTGSAAFKNLGTKLSSSDGLSNGNYTLYKGQKKNATTTSESFVRNAVAGHVTIPANGLWMDTKGNRTIITKDGNPSEFTMNPCGCYDPNCPKKDEAGVCEDGKCNGECGCECGTCTPDDEPDNDCGCTDKNCQWKDEPDACKDGKCNGECGCDCFVCKGEPPTTEPDPEPEQNVCGCTDPNCTHKKEYGACINGACGGDGCTCAVCNPPNVCGCDDKKCPHRREVDYCKDGKCHADGKDCGCSCENCKPKNYDIRISLKRSAELEGAIEGNNCYGDLSTAEYGIYSDAACTNKVGSVKADGSTPLNLREGTYYAKMTKAPVGYYVDSEVHSISIANGNALGEYTLQPMGNPDITPITLTQNGTTMIKKVVEGHENEIGTSGYMSDLSGIKFKVSYYKGAYNSSNGLPAADAEATFQTDKNGDLTFDTNHIAVGSWKFNKNGSLYFPLGTILIEETEAKNGLTVSGKMLLTITDKTNKSDMTITSGNHASVNQLEGMDTNSGTNAVYTYVDVPAKGGVSATIATSGYGSTTVGDASLMGAEFTIYNKSEHTVNYKGSLYRKNEAVCTIKATTPVAGGYSASLGSDALEFGSYEIKLTKAPEGYVTNEWSQTFTITNDGEMHYFDSENYAFIDGNSNQHYPRCNASLIMGGVTFGVADAETKQYEALANAVLSGGTFELYNRSKAAITINGRTYQPDALITTFAAGTDIDAYNPDGSVAAVVIGNKTDGCILPYGTYGLVQIESGKGYKKSPSETTFQIREADKMVNLVTVDNAITNQVVRSNMSFTKPVSGVDEMGYIPWLMTSYTTGESHILVTNEKGVYNSNNYKHAEKTNINDPDSKNTNKAVVFNKDGSYTVNDDKLDPASGTWFTGIDPDRMTWSSDCASYIMNNGSARTQVNNTLAAFPYDTYHVQELRCKANEGMDLVEFDVDLEGGEGGSVVIPPIQPVTPISMRTTLTFALGGTDVTKSVPAAENVTINDTILYNGLKTGSEYTVKGALHLIDKNGNDEGVVAENEVTFTADDFRQTEMDFTVNTRDYIGKKLVATEEIWKDGECVVSENDLENAKQTVTVGGVTDVTIDVVPSDDGSKVTAGIDIEYEGLEPGRTYTAKITLINADTGEKIKDKNGNDVVVEKQLVADASGSGVWHVDVEFAPGDDLEGVRIGAIVEISAGNTTYPNDPSVDPTNPSTDDPDGSVIWVKGAIDGYAANAQTLAKDILAAKGQSVYNAVELKGLRSDKQYRLKGVVYSVDEDGNLGAVKYDNGKDAVKTIDQPSSMNGMLFEDLDLTDLGGKSLVVYQTLYSRASNDDEWAATCTHHENDDADQMVSVAGIKTTLTVDSNGLHAVKAGGRMGITDKVEYTNLIPGQKYTINGTIHVREDKETENGYVAEEKGIVKDATASYTFVADDKDGSADIKFMFNTDALKGKVIVAYEDITTVTANNIPEKWAQSFSELDFNADDIADAAAKERLVASHADITDTAQAIGFAAITDATLNVEGGDGEGGNISIDGNGEVVITDTIDYEGLVPGQKYEVEATLTTPDGKKEIAKVEMELVPEAPNGSIDVTFTVKEDDLKDGAVLSYEIIKIDGTPITDSSDLDKDPNGDNVLRFISMDTVLSGSEDAKEIKFDVHDADDERYFINVEDVVTYKNLTPGKEYTLKGELHLKGNINDMYDSATSDVDNGLIQEGQEMKFTPKTADGSVTMKFKVDPKNYTKADIVAFESIYDGDKLVVAHRDITDKDQMVTIVRNEINSTSGIDTVLTGKDGEKDVKFDTYPDTDTDNYFVVVKDTVTYKDLIPGEEYTLKGEIHLKGNTNDMYNIASDSDNGLVQPGQEMKFTPDAADGEVVMEFKVDPKNINKADIVAFESIYKGDKLVAEHKDIKDADQTVTITRNDINSTSSIDTVLAGENDEKDVEFDTFPEEDERSFVTLNDKVTYKNLIPGKEYTLKGELHLKGNTNEKYDVKSDVDNGLVQDAQELKFTPKEADGEVVMTFKVNPKIYDKADIVAFESLYLGDQLIMEHKDIMDADQTVTIIRREINSTSAIDTVLTGEMDETKTPVKNIKFGGSTLEITDIVTYTDLIPNIEYTLKGELHVKGNINDKYDIKSDTDDGIVQEGQILRFTPETSNGTVEMKFEIDTAKFDKADIVAFESLYKEDTLIMEHKDIKDADQTVTIERGIAIDTVLSGEKAEDDKTTEPVKEIKFDTYPDLKRDEHKVVLNDAVAYTNLVPGEEYTLKGELHIKGTDAEGNITDAGVAVEEQTMKFTPETADGTVTMKFEYATKDMDREIELVAFETLYAADGKAVAEHKNMADADQTVKVVRNALLDGVLSCKNPKNVKEPVKELTFTGNTVTLYDSISYRNLIPKVKYTIKGELVMVDKNGKTVSLMKKEQSLKVTPKTSEGSVTMTMKANMKDIDKADVIAFISLYDKDTLIEQYKYTDDADQTVALTRKSSNSSSDDDDKKDDDKDKDKNNGNSSNSGNGNGSNGGNGNNSNGSNGNNGNGTSGTNGNGSNGTNGNGINGVNGNGSNGNSGTNGNGSNGSNGSNNNTNVKDVIKTGEGDTAAILFGILGLALLAGSGFFFITKTEAGRKLAKKLGRKDD